MKKALIPIVAAIALTTISGNAKPEVRYETTWWFSSTICHPGDEVTSDNLCPDWEDLGTNLAIPMGVKLPVDVVKQGWSCVREPVVNVGGISYGEFYCSDGHYEQRTLVQCKMDQSAYSEKWLEFYTPTKEHTDPKDLTLMDAYCSTHVALTQ